MVQRLLIEYAHPAALKPHLHLDPNRGDVAAFAAQVGAQGGVELA